MSEDEREVLARIDVAVSELVKWKDTVNALLYGTEKGEFGYFHKSNILWRLIILWPVMLGSIVFGAVMTFTLQHVFNR